MTDRIDTSAERAKLAALEGHTPGPWESSGGLVGLYIEGRHEWSSIALIGHVDVDHESEMYPNAQLIAAAPDLRDTLAVALAEIDRLRAEVERLKNSPEECCAKCGHPKSNHPYRHPFVAREALKGADQ